MRSCLLIAFALLLAAAVPLEGTRHGSEAAPSDTLRLAVDSGEPLVTALPGRAETTFRTLRAPALSWLVGRSFYWRTLPGERGREFVLLERRDGSRSDTLVLVVDVGSR